MGRNISRSIVFLVTLVAFCFSLVLLAKAQDPANPNANSNMNNETKQTAPKRRKSGRRRSAANSSSSTEATPDQAMPNANVSIETPDVTTTASPTHRSRRGRKNPAMVESGTVAQTSASEQTDLSGTYTGNFACEDAGVNGDTTITITGNQFTTADGKSGRVVAATTRGYTAVALQFGDFATTAPGKPATAPTIVSLRARKKGDRLILTSVPGSPHSCSFTPSGSVARSRGSRRARQAAAAAVPAATGTEVSSPSVTVPPATEATTPATPRRARGRRGTANKNSNMKIKMNETGNSKMNDGTGNATPIPSPTPR